MSRIAGPTTRRCAAPRTASKFPRERAVSWLHQASDPPSSIILLRTRDVDWETGCRRSSTCTDGSKPLFTSTTQPSGQGCWLGSNMYCCSQPAPYQNCENVGWGVLSCSGQCPAGKVEVLRDTSRCLFGSGALCCDPVTGRSRWYP